MKVALFEFASAIRSRRAIVTALLFALAGAGVMYLTISIFASLEEQVLKLLALPAADNPGAVTMTLWRSPIFKDGVLKMLGSSLVFRDILGQHPIALAFAGFIFGAVPYLTLITSAPVAASEIRSGAVRYALLRVGRSEWAIGVFLAEALVLLVSAALMAAAAAVVSLWRLPGWSAIDFVPSLFVWALRAWLYAVAWLGVFTGASLCVKTPGKATALAVALMVVLSVLGLCADRWFFGLDFLRPQYYKFLLWRSSFPALLQGVTGVLAVAFLYLGLGSAVFARRDV